MPVSRREEIEAKRLKLQSLRKQRQEREAREKQTPTLSGSPRSRSVSSPLSPRFNKDNVEKLVDELLVIKSPTSRVVSSNYSIPEIFDSSSVSIEEEQNQKLEISEPINHYVDISVQTDPKQPTYQSLSGNQRVEMYDKAVETLDSQIKQEEKLALKYREWEKEIRSSLEIEFKEKEITLESKNKELKEALEAYKDQHAKTFVENLESNGNYKDYDFLNLNKFIIEYQNQYVKDGDKQKIDRIQAYLDKSFNMMKQSLIDDFEPIFLNETHDEAQHISKQAKVVTSYNSDQLSITQKRSFFNEIFCHDRVINDLDWCNDDLIIAAYSPKKNVLSNKDKSKLESVVSDNVSLVLIWNLQYSSNIPKFYFAAPTEILSVCFNKNNSNIIYGGGYNGKIYSWDCRTTHRYPVSTTTSTTGKSFHHLYPIYSLLHKINPDIPDDAGYLISCSTDGTIASWSPFSLQQPVSIPIHLKCPPSLLSKYDELAPLTLGFINHETKPGLLLGCEDGRIYRIENWNSLTGSDYHFKKNVGAIDERIIYEGHKLAPVNKISCNLSRNNELSNLFISCGFDWNIKLWKYVTTPSIKSKRQFNRNLDYWKDNGFEPENHNDSLIEMIHPLLEINRDDSVMDIEWRPGVSSEFASVGADGKLEFWNLLKNTNSPILQILPVNDQSLGTLAVDTTNFKNNDDRKALLKLSFDKTGRKIATGGLNGFLNVFEIEDNQTMDLKIIDQELSRMFL